VPSLNFSNPRPPLAIPEFAAGYGSAFSSVSASTNSNSVNNSGGLRILGGIQLTGFLPGAPAPPQQKMTIEKQCSRRKALMKTHGGELFPVN
jgi:hypothetical protein